MNLHNPDASLDVPDKTLVKEALSRTTHLAIGAHQDDVEIMAFHGIRICYDDPHQWFGGVVVTDGVGSPRTGKYANVSEGEMGRLRSREQIQAAKIGRYSFIAQLAYPSEVVRDANQQDLAKDLHAILNVAHPRVVYTHNPADKHETHVAVALEAIEAIRKQPPEKRPEAVYGCEVWRSLDWLPDENKIALDAGADDGLALRLLEAFASQNEGGKNYPRATLGRWGANATFHEPYAIDQSERLVFAMDLTPLVAEPFVDVAEYVLDLVNRFHQDVASKVVRHKE
jgi:LmbE family N-acetylglucosaminyl deacetylase